MPIPEVLLDNTFVFVAAVLVIAGAFILVYAIRLHSQTQK